jgi:hypothetical protein
MGDYAPVVVLLKLISKASMCTHKRNKFKKESSSIVLIVQINDKNINQRIVSVHLDMYQFAYARAKKISIKDFKIYYILNDSYAEQHVR